MLNSQEKNERDLITNGLRQEVDENTMIENGISELMEREVVQHERNEPINKKIAQKTDSKAPDEECEYFDKGNLIKFAYIHSEIQKHILTIDTNDVITLCMDGWGISLILEKSNFNNNGKSFSDIPNVRKTKEGYIFRQRMIYKDALRILKRIGYKKESENINLNKEDNKVSSYYVSEVWVHEKHLAIRDHLLSIVTINKSDK